MFRKLLGVVAVSLAIAAFAVHVSGVRLTNQGPDTGREIPNPGHWIPFEADIQVHASGQVLTGKRYQNSEGSTCTIIGVGPTQSILIMNRPDRMTYAKTPGNAWTARPNSTLRDRPLRLFTKTPGVTGAVVKHEGRDAWEIKNANGERQLLIPELNFQAAVIQEPNGDGHTLSNIRVGAEPDPSLFRPPDGASVVTLPERPPYGPVPPVGLRK